MRSVESGVVTMPLWKPSPDEITDRLGWLSLPTDMGSNVADLVSFADEVARDGYTHVVLLGMGGSSLGPEMLRQAFGSTPERPELIVLDSTVPEMGQGCCRQDRPVQDPVPRVLQIGDDHRAQRPIQLLQRSGGWRRWP